jgi:flagellar biosynthetic protein FliR
MDAAVMLRALEPMLVVVLLAMARAGGLLFALPQFTSSSVPRMVKAIALVAISVSLVFGAGPPVVPNAHPLAIGVAMIVEVVIGAAMGFVVHLLLAAARVAGEILGVEMGLSFSAVADPANPGTSTATAAILGHLSLQFFFALRLDHVVVSALAHSTRVAPLGGAALSGDAVMGLSRLGSDMFVLALRWSLPVLAVLLTVKLAIAVLARFVPRLQIFSLAFGITLLIGLWALAQALPGLASAMAGRMSAIGSDLAALVAALEQ